MFHASVMSIWSNCISCHIFISLCIHLSPWQWWVSTHLMLMYWKPYNSVCLRLCNLCFYLQGFYSVNELSACPAGTGSSSGSVKAPPPLGDACKGGSGSDGWWEELQELNQESEEPVFPLSFTIFTILPWFSPESMCSAMVVVVVVVSQPAWDANV